MIPAAVRAWTALAVLQASPPGRPFLLRLGLSFSGGNELGLCAPSGSTGPWSRPAASLSVVSGSA